MEKNLYIDASHPDETRVVLKSDTGIEEYEYEDKNRLNFKSNIYLGTVSRVEPSLQAAFINFGRIKHGFLAFNDIQSDYYQIPTEDKEQLQEAEEKIREDLKNKNVEELNNDLKHENEDIIEKKDKQIQTPGENIVSSGEEKQDENVRDYSNSSYKRRKRKQRSGTYYFYIVSR
jgi:ribonuclease E